MNIKTYTALYCRISREDELKDINSSIETQKKYLEWYAQEQQFNPVKYYIDDGYSGTNFNRPAFDQLIRDIELKLISTVITKDLSRLGRNYLTTGYYIEHYFPNNHIRFIAINDQVDTEKQQNDLMPFKNIMNEWYARDISAKIKTAYRIKAMNGKFTGAYPPYGYHKDSIDKHKLIINTQQAAIVKRIFNQYAQGYTVFKIIKELKENKITTPRVDTYANHKKYYSDHGDKYPYDWSSRTILNILTNQEYLGHIVSNKHHTKSYKDKRLQSNPKKDWIVTKNTHDPIVDINLYHKVQRIINSRISKKVIRHKHLFIGKLRCESCGRTLTYSIDKRRNNGGNYVCSTYRTHGLKRCTSHYIRYDQLRAYVYDQIKSLMLQIAYDEKLFNHKIKTAFIDKYRQTQSEKSQLETINQRLDQLKIIYQQLYEDYALRTISYSNYNALYQHYQSEKDELENKRDEYQRKENHIKRYNQKIREFIELIKQTDIDSQFTRHDIELLIDKIVIGEKTNKYSLRSIQIHYKHIGKI